MQPVQSQMQTSASLRKNNNTQSAANESGKNVTDNQLSSMPAPKHINALQWDLSSTQERRELLQEKPQQLDSTVSDSTQDQQLKSTLLRHRVISQTVSEQIILDDVVDTDIQKANLATMATNETLVKPAATRPAATTEQSELDRITQQVKTRFAATAENKTEFHNLMQKSFGAQYDVSKAETMRQQALKGDFSWMPKIQLVNGSQLTDVSSTQGEGVGRGAYSQAKDTIFLSRDLLKGNPAMAEKILTEEMGHAIDARINTKDAKGDEGNIFSRLSYGEKISKEELAELQAENDSGTININGEKIEVEFFFRKLRRKIKKAFKKAVKVVSDVVSGAADIVKNVAKKAVEVVKDVVKTTVNVVKNIANEVIDIHKKVLGIAFTGFKAVMESELVSKIMMVAQFIPIPVVALVAKGYNVARAAYSVYQGVKHKSWSMALAGVANLAGGIGKLGGAIGASAGFVAKAATVAKYAGTAAASYNAIAKGDFAAAAGIATNFFGGDNKITQFIKQAEKADMVYKAVKNGDYLGAVGVGADLLQNFTDAEGDKVLQKIGENAVVIKGVKKAIKDGDYGDAASIITSVYGNDLNISAKDQETIYKVSNTFTKLQEVKELVENNDYAAAAQLLAAAGADVVSSPKVRLQLVKAGEIIKQVDNTITAVNEGRYDDAVILAANTLGEPLDAKTKNFLTDVQSIATMSKGIRDLIRSNDYEGAAKEINNMLNTVSHPDLKMVAENLKIVLAIAIKANEVYVTAKSGDTAGAVGLGSKLLQEIISDPETKLIIQKADNTYQLLYKANDELDKGNYANAAQTFINAANGVIGSAKLRDRLTEAGKIITQIDNTVTAVNEGRYDDAIILAAKTLGEPLDAKTKSFLTDIQTIANQSKGIRDLIRSKDYEGAAQEINNMLNTVTNPDLKAIAENLKIILATAIKANTIYETAKNGDTVGAVGLGSELLQELISDPETKLLIQKTGSTYQLLYKANDELNKDNYADAAQTFIDAANGVIGSAKLRDRLTEAGKTITQIDNTVTAVNEGRYGYAIVLAADILEQPLDDKTRSFLTNLMEYANKSRDILNQIKDGNFSAAIPAIKELLEELGLMPEIADLFNGSKLESLYNRVLAKADNAPMLATA